MAAIRARRDENEALARAIGREVVVALFEAFDSGQVTVPARPPEDEVYG